MLVYDDADHSGEILSVRFEPAHTMVILRDRLDALDYQIVLPAREQLEQAGLAAGALSPGRWLSAFGKVAPTNPLRIHVPVVRWLTLQPAAAA